jgi:excisionase family DNA binding protein
MTQNSHNRLLLRPREVAEELGISRALAYRWAQQGIIPSIRVGRSVRIPHDALLAWIAAQTQQESTAKQ